MKNHKHFLKLYLIAFILIIASNSYSQENTISSLSIDTISFRLDKNLPPLQSLIDSAIKNSPLIKQQNLSIVKNEYLIKSEKKKWTNNFGLTGDVIYGTWDNLQYDQSTGEVKINNQIDTRFGAGAYVRLPIGEFLNRNNEIEIARLNLEDSKAVKQQKVQEIRQLVITRYNAVVLNKKLIDIQNKNLQSTLLQLEVIEKQFVNGQASVEEFAKVSEISNTAEIEYEKAKSEFILSLMLLEEVVGVKLSAFK